MRTTAAHRNECADRAQSERRERCYPQEQSLPLEARPEQNELAKTLHEKVHHLRIAVALLQPFADKQAKIARERRRQIVDRLVLTDEATQLAPILRARVLRDRIGQDFVGLDRECALRHEEAEDDEERRAALIKGLFRGLGGKACTRELRQADAQSAIGERQGAAKSHDQRAEPNQKDEGRK